MLIKKANPSLKGFIKSVRRKVRTSKRHQTTQHIWLSKDIIPRVAKKDYSSRHNKKRLPTLLHSTFVKLTYKVEMFLVWNAFFFNVNRKFHIKNLTSTADLSASHTHNIFPLLISENPQKIIAQRHNKWTFEPFHFDPTVQCATIWVDLL